MDFFINLVTKEDGQGLAEYALIVFLIIFTFWLGIKDTNIGVQLFGIWSNIAGCLVAPLSCAALS